MSQATRVQFDAHQLGRRQTGNETYIRALLAEYRARDDLDVSAFVEAPALDDPLVSDPTSRIEVPRSGVARLFRMSRSARRDRPDLLHAIYFGPYLAGCPMVLTVHDISHEIHPEFFSRKELIRDRLLIRDAARRADVVITVSETSRADLIERYGLPDARVVAIHNGVASRFLEAPPLEISEIGDRPVRILAIGALQPRKNLVRLLEAVRRVSSRRSVALRVVGPDGYQADTIREQLQGAAEVEIAGYVDDDDLVDEYQGADMLVYPSIYEGFGLPVVEAMAVGLPVITSTGGSLPEVAGDAAEIIEPLDVTAMAEAIERLADDAGRRAGLSARGRERAKGFTWATAADRHVDVYRALVGR